MKDNNMIKSGSLVEINTKKYVNKKRFAAWQRDAETPYMLQDNNSINHGDVVLLLEDGFTWGFHNENPTRRTKVLYKNKIVYVMLKYYDEIL